MPVTIVGGGLAGCEAAWQLLRRGHRVRLLEMRPSVETGAHDGDGLAQLVCSNSLKGKGLSSAHGCLKAEATVLGSLLLEVAGEVSIPAGGALAVERAAFSAAVEERLLKAGVELVREELTEFPAFPVVIASGPLTSPALMKSLVKELGAERLFFHDATAPVFTTESLDLKRVFAAGRHGQAADYLNVGLNKEEYLRFREQLINLPRARVHGVEEELADNNFAVFEGCLPIEVLAERSEDALRYGPLRPIGLRTPAGENFYAVLQLRAEDSTRTRYNLVGCQTRLTPLAQRALFRSLPGLEQAEFVRYGRMHRNSYLNGYQLLNPTLELRGQRGIFVAGQLSGAEGYTEAIATGLLAGLNLDRRLRGLDPLTPPAVSLLGALTRTIAGKGLLHKSGVPAPVNVNFGLLPPLNGPKVKKKKERKEAYSQRSQAAMHVFRYGINN
ncbi:methylenetetrahydrofolate--tRNA-(uracil(54)-C(5))-methyltransferase (FADH(2)-oxidizing) TrmFO [bacterium]|nr:methylenetetrahydrofolate--tRNA-(uracil(54)-C(5))-methyltransferase (FADH(2)-oxidizing) TrmFO [bacterium]